MKNLLRFIAAVFGTVLLVAGLLALRDDVRTGGWYLSGAVLAFLLVLSPGRRLRDALRRQ